MSQNASQFFTVLVCADVTEAQIAKGALESAGIEAYVLDQNIAGVMPYASIALGGYRLQVLTEDVEEAKSILFPPNEKKVEEILVAIPSKTEIKKAAGIALLGVVFFPVVPCLFSVLILARTLKNEKNVFFEYPFFFLGALVFNFIGLIVYPILMIYPIF